MRKLIHALPTGEMFNYETVGQLNTINIYKLIDQLAHIKRFNGVGFSVLQHSYLTAELAWRLTKNLLLSVECLIHDVPEALLGDVQPIIYNKFYDKIQQMESTILERCRRSLNSEHISIYHPPYTIKSAVKLFDILAAAVELHVLAEQGKYVFNQSDRRWGALADVNVRAIFEFAPDIQQVIEDENLLTKFRSKLSVESRYAWKKPSIDQDNFVTFWNPLITADPFPIYLGVGYFDEGETAESRFATAVDFLRKVFAPFIAYKQDKELWLE